MIDLSIYQIPNRTALYTNIPIHLMDEFLKLKSYIIAPLKIRYRGPRAHRQYRSVCTRQSSCLKQDATSFSVYLK